MPKTKKKKESWIARLKKKVRKHFDKKKKEEEAFKATLKKVKDKKAKENKAGIKKSETKKSEKTKRVGRDTEEHLRRNISKTDMERLQRKKKNSSHKKRGGY